MKNVKKIITRYSSGVKHHRWHFLKCGLITLKFPDVLTTCIVLCLFKTYIDLSCYSYEGTRHFHFTIVVAYNFWCSLVSFSIFLQYLNDVLLTWAVKYRLCNMQFLDNVDCWVLISLVSLLRLQSLVFNIVGMLS